MSIKTKIISIVLVSIMAVALASPLAQAAIPKPNTLPGQTTAEQENVSAKEHVGTVVIPRIVNILIGAATLMCFALIIYGGIRYMLAYGDDEAINESKRVIIYSLVGLLIALFSYAIVAIITSVEFDKKVTLVPTAYAAYSEDDIKDIDSSIFVDGSKKDQFKQIENLPFVKIAKEDSETPGDIISYIRS
ncbi:pilin, partial [Patescibacteria group bacterium]|nr:pilin [Patescibacteria group bacterium]